MLAPYKDTLYVVYKAGQIGFLKMGLSKKRKMLFIQGNYGMQLSLTHLAFPIYISLLLRVGRSENIPGILLVN